MRDARRALHQLADFGFITKGHDCASHLIVYPHWRCWPVRCRPLKSISSSCPACPVSSTCRRCNKAGQCLLLSINSRFSSSPFWRNSRFLLLIVNQGDQASAFTAITPLERDCSMALRSSNSAAISDGYMLNMIFLIPARQNKAPNVPIKPPKKWPIGDPTVLGDSLFHFRG